jgi:hypothetical protein
MLQRAKDANPGAAQVLDQASARLEQKMRAAGEATEAAE